MSHRFIFSEVQLPEFRALAYAIRDSLAPYAEKRERLTLPAKTAMLDIAAELLGYPHYQAFLRSSKGHQTRSAPAVVLTGSIFDGLADRLAELLTPFGFTAAHCRWAVAGWFTLRSDGTLDAADVKLLKDAIAIRRPFPVSLTWQEQRLIDLECMAPVTQHLNGDPTREAMLIGVRPTTFGQWVGARVEAANKAAAGRKLSHLDLVCWGLPEQLCLMRQVESSVRIGWTTATPVDREVRLG